MYKSSHGKGELMIHGLYKGSINTKKKYIPTTCKTYTNACLYLEMKKVNVCLVII